MPTLGNDLLKNLGVQHLSEILANLRHSLGHLCGRHFHTNLPNLTGPIKVELKSEFWRDLEINVCYVQNSQVESLKRAVQT